VVVRTGPIRDFPKYKWLTRGLANQAKFGSIRQKLGKAAYIVDIKYLIQL